MDSTAAANEPPVSVPVADAVGGAVAVAAADVKIGDYVFSTNGRPHRVVKVRHTARKVRIVSEGLWDLEADPSETVTIRRSA